MKYLSLVLAFSSLVSNVFSQNSFDQLEYTNWYTGTSIMHFDLVNDTILFTDFTVQAGKFIESAFEGRSTASNEKGELLFFSAGSTVLNPNTDTIPGGTAALLAGNEGGATRGKSSTMQGLLFVKHPLNDSLYYAFTGDDALGGP